MFCPPQTLVAGPKLKSILAELSELGLKKAIAVYDPVPVLMPLYVVALTALNDV
jgi:hypothetical protein